MRKKIIKGFVRFRKIFSESKININRSLSYMAIINSGMILFLLLSRLQDYGINIHLTKWFIPIFILSIIVMMFIGYLDHRLGFHREESRIASQRNPYFEEIIERLERIEKKK